MEPDIEASRHHMSMSVPFGAIGWQNHRWNPRQISAYDMFDQVMPDLVMCSHHEYLSNAGLREYVENKKIKCLIRHEAPGDILRENTKTYTRYRNTEFKEYLPSCADIINFYLAPIKTEAKEFTYVCFKNYIPDDLFYPVRRHYENRKKSVALTHYKIFRGYNVNSQYHCGDLPDRELAKIIRVGNTSPYSPFCNKDHFITSDVLNAIHCAGVVQMDYKPDEYKNYAKIVYEYFGGSCNSGNMVKQWLVKSGIEYTNFDRAIQISKLFNLGVEKELKRESVKYK